MSTGDAEFDKKAAELAKTIDDTRKVVDEQTESIENLKKAKQRQQTRAVGNSTSKP